MGFRFRKTISIIPGVRINLSNGSASLSVGPRGASVSFGKRGTYANLGLPGTGLSYRTRLDRAGATSRQRSAGKQADIHLREELEREVKQLNDAVEEIINIHLLTPDPRQGYSYAELEAHYREQVLRPYNVAAPIRPEKPVPVAAPEQPAENSGSSFIGRIFESTSTKQHRLARNYERWQREVEDGLQENERVLKRYQEMRQRWAEEYATWQYEAADHQKKLEITDSNISARFAADSSFFESLLTEVLQATDWPRETLVNFQVKPGSSEILIDVDLPEVEDMPTSSIRVNARGSEIIEKELSQKVVREHYARHIHGIILRLVGIAFCALPFATVNISGFTQRINKQTGHLEDDYILSVLIHRHEFEKLNFERLENVDPVEALNSFTLQRRMSATCIFQTITPF